MGRAKVPLLATLQALCAASALAVALLPTTPAGGWMLAAVVIAARLLFGGVITLRSLVWTLNYPHQSLARVTSRLQILGTLTMTLTTLGAGRWLDARPESFAVVYAGAALLASLGVMAVSRIRIVGEAEHLALERAPGGFSERRGTPLRAALELLRRDRLYARYLGCQFVLGFSNMMTDTPFVWLVSRELGASYLVSVTLTLALPLALSTLTMPLWAIWLDRVHVAEFRASQGWTWLVSLLLTWLGALQGSLTWIAAGRFVHGLGRGGASLAWQLGHNHFARREDAGLYMGVHVTLTGVRGATAPFLGTLLYVGWSEASLPLGLHLPGFRGLGPTIWLVAAAGSAASMIGFARLRADLVAARDSHAAGPR
jgi:hypothetical protein